MYEKLLGCEEVILYIHVPMLDIPVQFNGSLTINLIILCFSEKMLQFELYNCETKE